MSEQKPTDLSNLSLDKVKELRNLGNVAITTLLMKNVIPKTEVELIKDIEYLIHNNFAYCDPTMLCDPSQWLKLKIVVNKHIKDTDMEWRKMFIDIYMNKL